ncbi:MAG: extracellular solute-binding protein [Streptosporangiales bacterium]|nr:extracellular solute-binding protein [Streptosporangiales bacterium]
MFEKAGIELPFKTLEDVYDAALKLKKSSPDSVPMSVQAKAGEGITSLKTTMAAAGVPFDGAKPDLQSPAAQYVLDWYKRFQAEGLLPEEAISWGEAEARGAFIRGQAGFILDGLNTAADFGEVPGFDYDKKWATTLMPTDTGSGTTGARISSARSWAITTGTEHPYEASLLLRYIADSKNLVDSVLEGAVPPRNTEALEDPRLNKFMPFFTDDLKTAFKESEPVPAALNAGEVEDVLEQLFGEIVTGTDLSAKQLADKYQPKLDSVK